MGKIVAIGGGEIKSGETLAADRYIVELADKERPNLLFIPTASHDAGGYINTVSRVYRKLGCHFSTLLFFLDNPSEQTVKEKIEAADIIYVGGGNTALMMQVWREKGVDTLLKQAYVRGTVMAGLSAGSICWFSRGYSDSESFGNPDGAWSYTEVGGLGLINAVHCPHYNEDGREGFDLAMKGEALSGVALENGVAFCVDGDSFRIIKSDASASAFLLKNKGGAVEKIELPEDESRPISELNA